MDYWDRLFLYRQKHFLPRVHQLVTWMMGITYLCAFAFILAIVYEYGFMISPEERSGVEVIYRAVWVVMLI